MLDTKFTKTEVEFIQRLAAHEFKTTPYYDTFRTQLKVHNICSKMNVCTMEEVLRKVIFYNLFEVNVSDEYKKFIDITARDYISMSIILRNQMLEFAKNTSQVFGELCTHSACINEEELKETAHGYLNTIYSDTETQRLFKNIGSFYDLIRQRYNFGMMFDNIFKVDDDCMDDVNALCKHLQLSAKYLMIVRMCIEEHFPTRLKRQITAKEKELLLFLSNKGDEIDYMEQYKVSINDFENMLNELYKVYDVVDMQELLIAFNIEQSFTESSLIYESFFLNIRANVILKDKDKFISKVSEDKKEQVLLLFNELEKFTLTEFLTPANMEKCYDIIQDYRDCDFTTYGKIDKLKELYYNNIQPLDDIKQLKNVLRQLIF